MVRGTLITEGCALLQTKSRLLMDTDDFKRKRKAYSELSIPQLIELLSSEYLRVRFLAEMALRDATST